MVCRLVPPFEEISLVNAFVCYRSAHPRSKLTSLDFRKQVVKYLLKDWDLVNRRQAGRNVLVPVEHSAHTLCW